jgi:AcrR family transcriptional regulator
MKSKTEAKRQEILKAAGDLFREVGFERTSMSNIRARVGGSKATLYNYFPSKEALFIEIIHNAKERELKATAGALNPDADDLKQELVRFGQNLLQALYTPDAIAARRLAISESRHSDSGKMSFEHAVVPTERQVADFLKKVMKRGALRTADAKVAAIHLLSLLEAEQLQRILLGIIDSVRPEAITSAVRRAVDVFLAGYAPN